MCATWVPQIIGAVPEIQHGESRVTTEGVYSPNVAMSIRLRGPGGLHQNSLEIDFIVVSDRGE